MSLKIAMTGHTKGIGKAIHDLLSQDNDVYGFSRTNGYNIMKPSTCKRIVSEIDDCDVFINNAYVPESQNRLLYELYEKWENQPKHIINISATSPDYPHFFGRDGYDEWVPYVSDKARLDFASAQLSRRYKKGSCKVTNLRPHFVDTTAVDVHRSCRDAFGNVITPGEVAEMVQWIVNQPKRIQIRRLDFCVGA